jgi:hypothetical protein
MTISKKDEKRILAKDEYELVEQSHLPTVKELSRDELADLAKLLRNRRDKATDQARQQRREQRGKSAPRGATPAQGNEGQSFKKRIFANALQRVNKYLARHRQIEAAQRALEMKQNQGASYGNKPGGKTKTSGKGMKKVANEKSTVQVHKSETGRARDFVRTSQAKKDSR